MSGIKTRLQEQEDLEYFAASIKYFETHDLSEELATSPEARFEVNTPRRKQYPLDTERSAKLEGIVEQRGFPAEILLRDWVREKTAEIETPLLKPH